MLKTTQIKLIHSLGGYTKDEYRMLFIKTSISSFDKGHNQGYSVGNHNGCKIIITRLMRTAIDNYGRDKQSWIDAVYSDMESIYKQYVK
uniref:Uncharacterized protein n=1 Tax=Geladintestivirus 6 TaxID=3233138 RepID=A0AAU8MJZ5_9CAUD